MTLQTPLSKVLGPRTATHMAEQLGLETVRDLLRHYPRRYARRGERVDLADVQKGDRVTIVAQVRSVSSRPMRGTRSGRSNRPGRIRHSAETSCPTGGAST